MTIEFKPEAGEQIIWSGRPIAFWLAIRRTAQPLLMAFTFVMVFFVYLHEMRQPAPRINPDLQKTMITGQIIFATMAGAFSIFAVATAILFWQRAYRTTYHLTNRRAVIDTAGPIPRRLSVPLEHVRFIDLRSNFLGPGDLIFAEISRFSIDGWGKRGEGFIAISEPAKVERLARDAIEETLTTRTRGPWQ
jgi:hypothetical protein